MAAWSAAGERVVVATLFTDGPPLDAVAPSMRALGDFQTRRGEDADACATVGAEVRWLGHVERAFRQPFLPVRACFTTRSESCRMKTRQLSLWAIRPPEQMVGESRTVRKKSK